MNPEGTNPNLARAFLDLARSQPDHLAIETETRQLTFSELMKAAHAVSEELAAEGIDQSSRLAIAMTRNEDTLIILLAAWLCGATALISDFRARAPEREKLVTALGLKFFVEDRPAPGGKGYPFLKLGVAGVCESLANRVLPQAPPENANPVAVIGVSSGTSGMPQPVALSHECLMARCEIARSSPQWQLGAKFAVSAPLAFSATRKHVLTRLLDGGTVFLLPLMAGPQEFVDAIVTHEVEAVLAVPAILRGLFPLAPEQGHLFPKVRWMMSCGAPMLASEKKMARDRIAPGFVQNYGSTMAGMVTLLETCDIDAHIDTVGKGLPQVEVQIVDADGKDLPHGEVGAIRIRTPGVAADLDEVSGIERRQSDLLVDGWIYPGDLGKLDQQGFLSIVGRSSDIIIRGGINVFPSEVEELLGEHPAVVESAVVGWSDPVVGEEIAAFVVLREEISPKAILAWCRPRIQPDKQPREVFVVPALPRNANGKVIKKELVAQLPERADFKR